MGAGSGTPIVGKYLIQRSGPARGTTNEDERAIVAVRAVLAVHMGDSRVMVYCEAKHGQCVMGTSSIWFVGIAGQWFECSPGERTPELS